MAPLLLGAVDALNRHVDTLGAAQLLHVPIARLVDDQRQAAGARLVSLELPGFLVALAAQAVVLFYVWRSGWAARWRDALRARTRSETAVRFIFGATLALIARIASLVPAFYLWRVDRIMGLSHALTRVWAYEYVVGTLLGMAVAGCVAAIVLWLVERTHQWYLYTIGGIIAISLLGTLLDPYVVAPIFQRYAPIRGPLASDARAAAARFGYASVPVLEEHRVDRIPVDPAKTQGMGVTQQIVLADTLVSVATPGEVAYYVADDAAQLDAHDPLNLAIIDAAIVIVAAALAVVVADRVGFRRDDDPISRIALVGAFLAIVYVPATLLDHGIVASMQIRAARNAVAMTHDPVSALRAYVRSGDDRVEQVCAGGAGRLLLYRSASLGQLAQAIGVRSGCPGS